MGWGRPMPQLRQLARWSLGLPGRAPGEPLPHTAPLLACTLQALSSLLSPSSQGWEGEKKAGTVGGLS